MKIKRPDEVEKIVYNPNFADCWTIVIDWLEDDNETVETITCSDNPGSPNGVFSSNVGDVTEDTDDFKEWEDLPESLQEYIYWYINDEDNY
jgi:hypothetical protein